MKIREIYVKSFGCLYDFKKEFHDGFNAVTENNGFGKTTLATFVKAMFYSLGYSRSSALEENELKRFRPWNSTEKFGGSVTFEHDGKLYRIERTFGATQKDETAFLVDFEKNKKTDVSKSDLGKRLFGIDAAAFERCLYLPQKQIEIKSNDSFVEKLSNLLDNAEDNNNFSAATARLREFSKKLRLERGSGGLLFETEQKKRQLEAQLCRQQEAQRKLDENRRQTLDALRAAEMGSARLKALDAQLKSLEKQRQNAQAAGLKQIVLQRQSELEQKLDALEAKQSELKAPQKKPSKKFTLCACAGALVLAALSVLLFCLNQAAAGGIFAALLAAGAAACFFVRKKRLKTLEENFRTQSRALEAEKQTVVGLLEKARRELTQCAAADACEFDEKIYGQTLEEREKLAAELSARQALLAQLKTEAEFLARDTGDVADTENMLDNATERLEALRKKYITAQTAMRLLAQAKEKLTTAYAPKLRENFLSLVSQATDGAFSDAIVSADFRTELTADGATREMGYFSKGTRELSDFCLRLALIKTMYGGNPPILILDDPFVNLDDGNFRRAVKLLKTAAPSCQIIYLSCTARATVQTI